ncbi:MAG: 2Fe-2S iron-sulfur cluster binding domain-containing protein [Gammaproteobacteria bacterium]|nr:2Fe-2S iron-sulfur cluster binding domain-containing protein [Gammaproteobacteria bacterium]
MAKLLSVSRAARLAGVSRGELQKRIREEKVETFEGELTVELLLQLYPHIDLDADPMLEKVRAIRSEAKPKSHYSDGWMPDPEILMKRLKEFQHVLVQTKSALNASDALLQETLTELQTALQRDDEAMREAVLAATSHLTRAMQRAERAEDASAALFAKDMLLKIVSASVRLLPSGHEFFLEGSESILDAGLRAGLYIDYGCSSGNCGACKCRVVSGAVRKLRNHDYVLSAKEQEQGYILACSNTAISDLVVEASEAGVEEELPQQTIRAVVKKIEPLDDELALLQVQTPRTQSLRFKAGQQLKLTMENGATINLCIASCPCDGRNLQFIVARREGEPFSDALFSGKLQRQTLLLEGPSGGFLLQEESSLPAIFLAAGTGFAPIKSLVEQAIAIDNAEGLHLIQPGGNPKGSHLDNLCRSWNDSLDNFLYTAPPRDSTYDELLDLLAEATAALDQYIAYIAGPTEWLDRLLHKAQQRGMDIHAWHVQAVD